MHSPWSLVVLAVAAASGCSASPLLQYPFAAPAPPLPKIPHKKFNHLDHMSGISPYHDAPNADIRPPASCKVVAASTLLRHTSIYANDDEYEDYMQPFIERVERLQKDKKRKIDKDSPLSFLNRWTSPINDDNLEDVTDPGRADAREFGVRMRDAYGHLMPPKQLGKNKSHGRDDLSKMGKKGKKVPPFKVWSASSKRDVITSEEWIKGAFPHWQGGDEGDGDGTVISLVKVPNNSTEWAEALTPHKVCPAFSKEVGKPEAQEWLEHYGPPILDRWRAQAPGLELELNDVIAMAMLCGYETVITKQRESQFCSRDIFTPDDFRAFGYWNDIKYHFIVGYASPVAPYLGIGWLNTSTHNLLSIYDRSHGDHDSSVPVSLQDDEASEETSLSKKKKKNKEKPELPGPSHPPGGTHSQLFFAYVTHREEPPLAAVALGIWNTTSLATDHIERRREWQTSHLLPFLGHITIERLACDDVQQQVDDDDEDDETKDAFVRVVVNGAPQALPYCHDGPGGTCPIEDFATHVRERSELWKDREGACEKRD